MVSKYELASFGILFTAQELKKSTLKKHTHTHHVLFPLAESKALGDPGTND